MGYEYGPSENAIVINTTSQLSRQLANKFGTSAVLAPTRREENVLGYDVDVRDLLGVVLQFKRPSVVKAMRRPSRISKPAARFSINTDQLLTLRAGFSPEQAFFALSPLHDSSTLHEALERSIFVDVFGLPATTSKLYTACDCCTSKGKPLVEGLIKNGTKFSIPNWYIYCMDDFKSKLQNYHAGIRIKERGQRAQNLYYVKDRLAELCTADTESISQLIGRNSSNWAEVFVEEEADFYGVDFNPSDRRYDVAKTFIDEAIDSVVDNIDELSADIEQEKAEVGKANQEFHPMNFVLRRSETDFCLFGENGDE